MTAYLIHYSRFDHKCEPIAFATFDGSDIREVKDDFEYHNSDCFVDKIELDGKVLWEDDRDEADTEPGGPYPSAYEVRSNREAGR